MSTGVQTDWLDTNTDTYLPSQGGHFGPGSSSFTLAVDAGTGTVVVQMEDSTGTWVATADGTISADDTKIVDVPNGFGLRIHATGDAKYRVNWAG